MVVDRARRQIAWLRKPGSLLKVLCAFLAFCSFTAGLAAYSAEQRARELGDRIVVISTQCDTDKQQLQQDVQDRDARLAQIADNLRAEAEKLKALRAESAAALAGLADDLAKAETDAKAWRLRYDKRPKTCQAALEVLDEACSGQGGF
ncbi:hypothetical protein A7A76_07745 [Lysobacter enzymogenes]|nr:hypothetical protein [Lysobacter enzymogenes]